MRVAAIDMFRGLSIVLMVVFTVILVLSNILPWPLTHNVPGTLRPGDFVFPMFIFASGMSLVFFDQKRKKLKRNQYILDVIERFGKLVLIWFFLSPFSAGRFLGVDEILVIALLMIPSLLLVKFSEKKIAIVALSVFILYFVLSAWNSLPYFNEDYLGGYGAVIFYLPVMLAGVITGKNIKETKKLIVPVVIISLLLLLFIQPYKNIVSPSFMALSVLVSLVLFECCKKIKFEPLEYLGKKPIRYWVLMFLVIGIPIVFYAGYSEKTLPLDFDWPVATIIVCFEVVVLYLISKLLDKIQEFIKN
ncbi:MAG: heparan-alpha-glucosaminide N-acetyltransferase domain-containing protein, partial [Candidatus Micrarchaeota archaeon]